MSLSASPEELAGRPLPDLELPSSQGGRLALRAFVGRSPFVLFFYVRNATPG